MRKLGAALAAGLTFWWVARFVWRHERQIRALEFDVNPWMMLASCLALLAYFAGRIWIWRQLTQGAGADIGAKKSAVAWLYSQLGKYVPGKVFVFLSRLYWYRASGSGVAAVSTAFAYETMATVIASAAFILIGLVATSIDALAPMRLPAIGALVLGLALFHPSLARSAFAHAPGWVRRRAPDLQFEYRSSLKLLVAYTTNWLLFGVAFYLLARSITAQVAPHPLYLLAAFSGASLAGMFAVFVPSGLGVREGVLIAALTPIASPETAIVIALAARLWFTAVELLSILLVSLGTGLRPPSFSSLRELRGSQKGVPPNA